MRWTRSVLLGPPTDLTDLLGRPTDLTDLLGRPTDLLGRPTDLTDLLGRQLFCLYQNHTSNAILLSAHSYNQHMTLDNVQYLCNLSDAPSVHSSRVRRTRRVFSIVCRHAQHHIDYEWSQ
jgi:hypothetical protein